MKAPREKGERKFLLFCPDLGGHRHLYCRYFVDYLRARGLRPTLAYAGRAASLDARKIRQYENFLDDAARDLLQTPELESVDICEALNQARDGLKVAAEVARHSGATDIIHVDADLYRNSPQFFSANSELGAFRNYPVLLITEYDDMARYHVSARTEVRSILQGFFQRRWFAETLTGRGTGCHYFPRFTRRVILRLIRSPVVTRVIHCDERNHAQFGPKSVCLPEIGTSEWTHKEETSDEFALRIWEEVARFCAAHPARQPLVMLGDLEQRKGYSLLLRMCARLKETVCIRVGRTKPGYVENWESVHAREQLLKEGRLYEMNSYVSSWWIYRKLLCLAGSAVLPYRRHYRTSGWFTDAISLRLPVVVPHRGLMAYRVKRYGLGEIFKEGDLDSLCGAFQTVQDNPAKYGPALESYARSLERKAIYQQWDECFKMKS